MRQLAPGEAPRALSRSSPPSLVQARPSVRAKFLFVGSQKLYVRGVTYGTFRPDVSGHEYPRPEVVESDFAQMRALGINAVRTYTVPPRSLLDAALRHGLRVMVGVGAERYIGFLIDKRGAPDIPREVAAQVRTCAGHPALLCYGVANEIPAPIVRWHGRRRIEGYLEHICRAVKSEDPGGLVTYVNYPTTEYLELPFLDLVAFNVYLEARDRLEAYLARLHNLAGDRPLLMSELGMDSLRNGEHVQARTLEWQLRASLAAGCAGAFVYAWTDEWYRGGKEVHDWKFGITERDRRPKLALAAVRRAFAEVPFAPRQARPRISVVVCSFNGARTIRDTLEGLLKLDYPDYQVIVIDDGSTDATAAIVEEFGFQLIRTENRGLSAARNTGLAAASGEIVAYIDDDAYPDPHWLTYLAESFQTSDHAGVGGPNIAPPRDGPIAECVANAPGGPAHVLISDREAEHLPGCNMAFRRSQLQAIGGFDEQFRVAGDDVDLCWRMRDRGWTLGFSPAAVVWHHRRNSVRAYWRQQLGYGKAEALLERKWPQRYNEFGHAAWAGRVYGRGRAQGRGRIYHGTWGAAPFQSLYEPAPRSLSVLPRMPEWYLVLLCLAALSALGALWAPLLWASLLLALGAGASLVQAFAGARRASFTSAPRSRARRFTLRLLAACLHLMQPAARLRGRLKHGLSPWRLRTGASIEFPRPRTRSIWTDQHQPPESRLAALEQALRAAGAYVRRGGDFDRWDLEIRGGALSGARLLMAVEEHGGGRQYVRLRCWPRITPGAVMTLALVAGLAVSAALDAAHAASAILGATGVLIGVRMLLEYSGAMAAIRRAVPPDERARNA